MINTASMGTILFVDDEPALLRSLKRIFALQDYQVFTAENGKEGLDVLLKEKVDVIVSDMQMPVMDGVQFLKEAAQKYPYIKRILLTGHSDLESTVSAINEGKIDNYITKPWQAKELEIAVISAITNKKLLEKNKHLQADISSQNKKLKKLALSLDKKVQERTEKLKLSYTKLKKTYKCMINAFANLIDIHDQHVKTLRVYVAKLARAIAKESGLVTEEVDELHVAGLLYNLGKISLPKDILNKSINKLSADERKIFNQYPILGEAALMTFDELQTIATAIACHRENVNGTGYPNQIKGAKISIAAKILSVSVDFYELQFGILTGVKLSEKAALEFLWLKAGVIYDPNYVQLLETVVHSSESFKLTSIDEATYDQETQLSIKEIKSGMLLSRDLSLDNGLVLLPKGLKITDKYIDKLKAIDKVPSIYVVV